MTTTQTTTITAIKRRLDNQKPDRSAWNRGVKEYTYELLEEIAEALEFQGKGEECPTDQASLMTLALNGADDWSAYSCGMYGINGGLLQDRTSGNMYAVTARNSTFFILF